MTDKTNIAEEKLFYKMEAKRAEKDGRASVSLAPRLSSPGRDAVVQGGGRSRQPSSSWGSRVERARPLAPPECNSPRNATLRCLRDVRPETANGDRRAASPPQVPAAGCAGARGCAVPARTAARGQAERRFQQDVVREAVLLPHISEDPSPVTFSTMLQRFQSVLSLPIA